VGLGLGLGLGLGRQERGAGCCVYISRGLWLTHGFLFTRNDSSDQGRHVDGTYKMELLLSRRTESVVVSVCELRASAALP